MSPLSVNANKCHRLAERFAFALHVGIVDDFVIRSAFSSEDFLSNPKAAEHKLCACVLIDVSATVVRESDDVTENVVHPLGVEDSTIERFLRRQAIKYLCVEETTLSPTQ